MDYYIEAKHTIKSKLEQLASDGVFGKGRAISIDFQDSDKGQQFMSSVFFVSVELEGGRVTHVVVKIQINDEEMRNELGCDGFFHNEEYAYLNLLPFLQQETIDVFPACFYGCAIGGENSKEDMIVLEDISKKGFRLTEEIVSLDFDHLSLAVHKLGQFHGLSHRTKLSNGGSIQNELKCSRFSNAKGSMVKSVFCHTLKKTLQAFERERLDSHVIQSVLHVTETNENWLKFLTIPEEPFAVICHGDFNRNNLMFKYRHERPVDVKFYDLQWATYSDPVVDLGFILYMNTNAVTRATHWERLLEIYWSGVTRVSPQPGFTFEEFQANFAKRVALVLGDIAFFLPIMISAKNKGPTPRPKDMIPLPVERKLAVIDSIGGSEARRMVDDVVKHMNDRRYFDAFVQAISSKSIKSQLKARDI